MTVMVATGIMSPESQKASNSPHAIIEMGLAESSITVFFVSSMAFCLLAAVAANPRLASASTRCGRCLENLPQEGV